METVLDLLLIRFGIIVGLVVLAALVLFGIAVAVRRRGHGDALRRHADRARRYATPVVTDAARDLAHGRRSVIAGAAARAAGRYLADRGAADRSAAGTGRRDGQRRDGQPGDGQRRDGQRGDGRGGDGRQVAGRDAWFGGGDR